MSGRGRWEKHASTARAVTRTADAREVRTELVTVVRLGFRAFFFFFFGSSIGR